MRINPANIQTPKQAKAHTEAQRIMQRVDEVVDAVDRFDQSGDDFNKTKGSVLVDKVMIEEGGDILNPRRWTDGATLTREGDRMEFQAKAELAGSWGFLPMGLEAKVSKSDSPEATAYKIKYEGSVSGPSTHIVEVDKKTGEWDVKKRWMGIFPASLDS